MQVKVSQNNHTTRCTHLTFLIRLRNSPPLHTFVSKLPLPWRWRHEVSPKCWYLYTKLHGVTSKRIIVFNTLQSWP